MGYEFLKETLGGELYGQFDEKMRASGIELVNAADGSFVAKARLDEESGKLQAAQSRVTELESALAEKDKAILDYEKRGRAAEALREAGARDTALLMRLISLDDVKLDDKGGVSGLTEQIETLQKNNAYLFRRAGSRGGVDGAEPAGGQPAKSANQTINDEIRRASGRG